MPPEAPTVKKVAGSMRKFFEEKEKLTTQYTEGLICNLEYLYALQDLAFTQAQREVAILKQQRIEIDRQLKLAHGG